LSVCWSDGASFLPLDFALLSSAKKKNRLQEVTKKMDKRSCGYKRRIEAQSKATDLLEPMIQRILSMGIRANYLLMDSWFTMPATVAKLRKHIHVVGMIKKTPRPGKAPGQRFSDHKGWKSSQNRLCPGPQEERLAGYFDHRYPSAG
ncbi:MAG: hypothetical protein R6T91_05405, partial [Bacteroidales bacterium]